MSLTLLTAITASDTVFDVLGSDDLETGDFKTIDSETIVIRRAQVSTLAYGQSARQRVSVYRGSGGTRAAAHAANASLATYSGGGSGGVTVDNGSDPPAAVTTIVAAGADISVAGEAALGRWLLTVGNDTDADLSVTATATNDGIASVQEANVSRSATATGLNDAYADTLVSGADGDAHANTTATVTGVQDANARTTVTTVGGNADITRRAEVSDAEGGDAVARTQAISEGGDANTRTAATTGSGGGTAQSYNEANVVDGDAESGSFAYASGDGDATAFNEATADGGGMATARSVATRGVHVAGVVAEADAVSARMGFFNVAPVAKPSGVAVSAVAIHAALVSLGLIEA